MQLSLSGRAAAATIGLVAASIGVALYLRWPLEEDEDEAGDDEEVYRGLPGRRCKETSKNETAKATPEKPPPSPQRGRAVSPTDVTPVGPPGSGPPSSWYFVSDRQAADSN